MNLNLPTLLALSPLLRSREPVTITRGGVSVDNIPARSDHPTKTDSLLLCDIYSTSKL